MIMMLVCMVKLIALVTSLFGVVADQKRWLLPNIITSVSNHWKKLILVKWKHMVLVFLTSILNFRSFKLWCLEPLLFYSSSGLIKSACQVEAGGIFSFLVEYLFYAWAQWASNCDIINVWVRGIHLTIHQSKRLPSKTIYWRAHIKWKMQNMFFKYEISFSVKKLIGAVFFYLCRL